MATQHSSEHGPSFHWRTGAAGLRVSDADRNEVADRLSKHYTEGRLDQREFSERLDRAMSARTQSDLAGLLDDLPGTGQRARQPHRGRLSRFLLLVLAVVVAAAVGQAILRSYIVLVLLAVVVLAWLRYGPRRRR